MSQGYWPGRTVGPAASCMTEYEWAFKVMQGGKLFYLFYLNGTHTHLRECIHSQKITYAFSEGAACESERRWEATQHTHSFLNMISLRMYGIYIGVYREMFMQLQTSRPTKWNGDHPTEYIAMLLTSVFGRPMINFTCQNEYPEDSFLKCFAGKLNQSHDQIWTC